MSTEPTPNFTDAANLVAYLNERAAVDPETPVSVAVSDGLAVLLDVALASGPVVNGSIGVTSSPAIVGPATRLPEGAYGVTLTLVTSPRSWLEVLRRAGVGVPEETATP